MLPDVSMRKTTSRGCPAASIYQDLNLQSYRSVCRSVWLDTNKLEEARCGKYYKEHYLDAQYFNSSVVK